MYSLAGQRNWQANKLDQLQTLVSALKPIPINRKVLVDAYVQIDVFSQGKDPHRPLPGEQSARNMGKNDLWIAATAMVVQANLITFDRDFDHLHQQWFEVYTL